MAAGPRREAASFTGAGQCPGFGQTHGAGHYPGFGQTPGAGQCPELGQTPGAGQYMTPVLLGFAVLLLSRYLLKRRVRERCKLPPGPTCWPLIGSLLSLARRPGSRSRLPPHLYLTALGKTYGEICRLYLGRRLMIILNGFQVVRDALQHNAEVFSDRPTIPLITIITKRKGIVFAPYGLVWKQQRKFSLSTLRHFGFGKLDLEPKIIEELQFVKSEFSNAIGTAFSPSHVIHNAVSNIICSMCFGKRFDYDDEEFRTMLNLIVRGMKLASNSSAMLINVIPLLQYLPLGSFKEVAQTVKDVTAFLKNIIDQHRKTMDPENPRDFVDFYLKEIDYQRHKKQNTSFSEDYLFYIIGDLFVAGTDTTSNTLLWAILFMAAHPEIQERVHKEISTVIGESRPPSLKDKLHMPFTEATIMEIQRMTTVVPLAIPHMASETVDFKDYTIPKGSMVVANLWSVHRDPSMWEHPDEFNPSRFLSADGNIVKNEAFMPFGIGKRICMGEQMAKMELFLIFSTLLQSFCFKLPEGTDAPNMAGQFGLTLSPHPFKIIPVMR
ncbi:cytochrome P450 2U1-like [Chiloscyllium punctatum]|uniref:cytochrome P450 2U1-like n=1 Tax=Chiloscyllium punctatum TaxID=137246 RepID=UPI003B63DCA5